MHIDFLELTLKILHVDDDEDDFIIMRDVLENIGDLSFEIEWIGTYEQALERLRQNEHDLCLLDFHLGERNGLELMQQALIEGCTIPFVMLTGTGSRDIDLQAMRSGVSFYVDKDRLDAYDLERAIRYSLEHARLLRALQELNQTLEKRVLERTHLLEKANKQLEAEIAEREKAEAELQKLRNERVERTLQHITNSLKASVTSQQLGIYPLRESAPEVFERLVQRYSHILELALKRRAFWVEDDKVSDELRDLAEQLGALQIGPRDVVEIYNLALQRKNGHEPPQKADVYVEEGRLTLLELMGYLVSYYRNLTSGTVN